MCNPNQSLKISKNVCFFLFKIGKIINLLNKNVSRQMFRKDFNLSFARSCVECDVTFKKLYKFKSFA